MLSFLLVYYGLSLALLLASLKCALYVQELSEEVADDHGKRVMAEEK